MKKDCKKCLLRDDQKISSEEIQLLTRYIPYRISRFIGESDCCIFEKTVEKLEGTVVYFDIIGFTSILVKYIAKQRDIAGISDSFSEFYSVIIETVRGLGGSIFQFAGDSLLIAFERLKGESEKENFHRALSSMLLTLELSDNYNSVTGKANGFSLCPKIGIGTGAFYQLLLGSQDQYITPVIAGPAVKDAVSCEEACTTQEIVISPSAYKIAQQSGIDSCFLNADGVYHLASVPENYAADVEYPDLPLVEDLFDKPRYYNRLSAFLNPAILQQIKGSVSGFAGEYKNITCIMAQFGGTFAADLGSDNVGSSLSTLNTIYALMQTKAERYGGFCLKPDLSDKGVVFPVLFGTPKVIENKERNALLCASEIIETAMKSPDISSAHIGIAEGMVYSGEFGGYMRKDYTVIGNSVNFASRLMTCLPESDPYAVMIDEQTQKTVSAICNTEAVSGIRCKGYDEAQTAYRFTDMKLIRRSQRENETIIGRDKELNRLCTLFKQSSSGHTEFVPVIGEAGSGKSFLVEQFAGRAVLNHPDTQILYGTSYQYEESTPLFCWRPVIKNILQISDAKPASITQELLSFFFSEHFAGETNCLPFLLNMCGLSLKEDLSTAEMDPAAKQKAFFDLIRRMLLLFAEKSSLIIVLEDIQWCDEVSLKLLEYMVASLHNACIMVIPVSRETARISDFLSSMKLSAIKLTSLGEKDASTLAETLLNLNQKQPALAAKIISAADGHPMFIQSIVQNLIENGTLIETKTGKRDLSADIIDLQKIIIPSSIQNIILARLSSLKFEEQIVCKTASAIGKTFLTDYLTTLLPEDIPESSVSDMLSDFESHNLIIKNEKDNEYSFTNMTVHDVIYGTILDTTKKELNRLILSTLEKKYAERLSDISDRLLYHAKEAGDPESVFRYSKLAADKAVRQFAVKDAVSLYQCAISIWDSIDKDKKDIHELYKIQLSVGDSYRIIGDFISASENFTMLINNCRDRSIRTDALRGLGRCYQEQGNFEKAVETLEKALALLNKRAPKSAPAVYAAIAREAAVQAVNTGLKKENIKRYENRERTDAEIRSDVLSILSKLYYFGLTEKIAWSSIANYNNTLHIKDEKERFCIAAGDYATTLVSAGLTPLGKHLFEQTYVISQSGVSPLASSIFKARYAYYFLFYNNPAKSIELLKDASDYFRKTGEQWELMTAVGALAQNYFLVGDFEKSIKSYKETEETAQKVHSEMHIGWAYNKIPFMKYLTGEFTAVQAEEQLLEGIKISESVHDHMTLCIHYGHLAHIASKEHEAGKALKYAEQIMHENSIYRINIPHVKISYVNAVEAVSAAF